MISSNSATVSIVVMVLAAILPHFGITIGNEALTTTVETIIELGLGTFVYFRHKKVVGAANAVGARI